MLVLLEKDLILHYDFYWVRAQPACDGRRGPACRGWRHLLSRLRRRLRQNMPPRATLLILCLRLDDFAVPAGP